MGPVPSPAPGAILGAAARTFAHVPYEDVTVEDLLRASGISRGTFYKYFRSKEDVLVALYERMTTELVRGVLAVAREGDEPMAAIRFGIDAYLDFHLENARLLSVLVEQAIRRSSPLFPHRRALRDDLFGLIGAAFRGHTGEAAPPWLMTALISALEGVSLELTRGEPTAADVADAKAAVHRLVDAVLAR